MDHDDFLLFFVFGIFVIFGFGGCVSMAKRCGEIQQEAIQLGYAEYNKTNGTWQWVTNK